MNTSIAKINIQDDTLSLSGVLDFESVLTVDALGQDWLQNLAPPESYLDLSQIEYSSSAGIALLLGWLRAAQKQKKVLHFKNIPESLLALVKVSGLEEVIS
jgi:phospholipid transport system transporter-binding protein